MGQYFDFSASMINMIASANKALIKPAERLSSGLRINSAADDAAGLAIGQSLRADMATIRQGSRNASMAISMMQTADGAAQQIGNNLIRMKELTTQASSGILTDNQKSIIQTEFNQLSEENKRIADTTKFNGKKIFIEGETNVAVGGNIMKVQLHAISQANADLVGSAANASKTVDDAINQLSILRGSFGSMINQIDSATEMLDNKAENIMAAQSRIEDADMAMEITGLASAEVQSQTAAATQVHSSLMSNMVLSMLE